jgi:hypothetical protein
MHWRKKRRIMISRIFGVALITGAIIWFVKEPGMFIVAMMAICVIQEIIQQLNK